MPGGTYRPQRLISIWVRECYGMRLGREMWKGTVRQWDRMILPVAWIHTWHVRIRSIIISSNIPEKHAPCKSHISKGNLETGYIAEGVMRRGALTL